eukprot:CAMPEP_0173065886 /NCGR_PEP_ID=MMETSP1102-20130122/5871_1 /TAXON_ID=49646 /ORGANISM="Geminigera sp., Strain Caron Lab Isolate" /LENGTH=73 /DNA_ID=CAMNT_0013933215 /DNA_START=132 /DNA_END=350 /DNA_ORIENTATION=-
MDEIQQSKFDGAHSKIQFESAGQNNLIVANYTVVGTTGVSGKVVGRIEESERIGGGDVVKGGAVGNRGRVMCT